MRLIKSNIFLKKINNLEKEISELKDNDFPNKTAELKSKLNNGKMTNEILCEAFALVREASKEKEERDILMFRYLVE